MGGMFGPASLAYIKSNWCRDEGSLSSPRFLVRAMPALWWFLLASFFHDRDLPMLLDPLLSSLFIYVVLGFSPSDKLICASCCVSTSIELFWLESGPLSPFPSFLSSKDYVSTVTIKLPYNPLPLAPFSGPYSLAKIPFSVVTTTGVCKLHLPVTWSRHPHL